MENYPTSIFTIQPSNLTELHILKQNEWCKITMKIEQNLNKHAADDKDFNSKAANKKNTRSFARKAKGGKEK